MLLTAPVLRGWEPAGLLAAADDLDATADLLARLRDGAGEALELMVWRGEAADAARASGQDLCAALLALRESFTLQAEALSRARPVLRLAQELLAEADRLAAAHDLRVLPDGSVTRPPSVVYAADAPPEVLRRVAVELEAASGAQARAQSLAREALASARECDRDAAAGLREGDRIGVLLARVAPGMGRVLGLALPVAAVAAAVREGLLDAVDRRPVPEPGSDPREVSAWWASLPAGVQGALLAADPGRFGGLDGLPAAVRDRANRAALAGARAGVQAEIARLQGRLDGNWFGGTFSDDDAALGYARRKLAALDVLEATIIEPGRRLLLLDLSGEQVKAAVAVGDVDTAEHVAVFTPGADTTVQDWLPTYDRQMDALRKQSLALAGQSGSGTVATVAWLGYQAPQWSDTWRPSRSVVSDEAAQRGADRLVPFLSGLDAARPVPAHLTALGHSYGSLTTGLALQRGSGVDDAVFFGSPGLGTSELGELGLRPGRAYVVEARKDWVADFAAFGVDPNQLPGITGLAATERVVDGRLLRESTGHTGYLTDDSTSQYAMAAVVAGLPELAPRDTDEGRGLGDLVQTPLPGWLR